MNIKGNGIYTDADGKSHRIIGSSELPDGEHLQSLKTSGKLSFDKISCDEFNVSGKCNGGSISARDLKTSGELSFDNISCDDANISGRCEGDSVTAKNFSASGKVEVDSLNIEQTLKLSGKPQINSVTADEIFIGACDGSIGKIRCRHIKIFEHGAQFAERTFENFFGENFFFGKENSHVRIKSIDAETVELENCAVEGIKCRDAFIGKNCAIEKLIVAGKCIVAADSTVAEIIRT